MAKLPMINTGANGGTHKPPTKLSPADFRAVLDNAANATAQIAKGGGGASTGLPLLYYKSRGDEWNYNRKKVNPEDLGRLVVSFTSIHRGLVEWIGKDGSNKRLFPIAAGKEVGEDDLPRRPDPSKYTKSGDGVQTSYEMSGALLDTGEPFTFATSSVGGAIAVRDLVDAARNASLAFGEFANPVVVLESISYGHSQHGETFNPVFSVIGYVRDSVALKGDITEKDIVEDPSAAKGAKDKAKPAAAGRDNRRDDRRSGARR